MTINELREKSLKLAHEARDLLNTVKDDNSNFAEVNEQFARMMTDSDDYAARADGLEQTENRDKAFNQIVTDVTGVNVTRGVTNETDEARAKAFDGYIRGDKSISELRAMGITGQEGVITPTSFTTALITASVTEGPMLDPTLVNLISTATGNAIEMPTFSDDEAAVIVGENTELEGDDLGFGSKTLGAYKYSSKLVRISNELLQDASVPVESIVSTALGKRIGKGTNAHFTTGTGVNQPQGIVTAAGVGVTAALATAFTAEDLFALQHSIDAGYRANATFMFNDAVLLKIRTMKDGDGRYVWQPGLSVGAPATVLNSPYRTNRHMSATFTTGQRLAVYGDMRAYTVRQAKDIFVRRLSERFADFDQTAFVALARFDGALLDSAAVKCLRLA